MTNKWIDEAEQSLLHTYNRYPIVLERGEGVYLYDTEGKKYLGGSDGPCLLYKQWNRGH